MFPQQSCGMCCPKMPPEGDVALLYLSLRMLPLEASYERRCPNRPLGGGGGGRYLSRPPMEGIALTAILSGAVGDLLPKQVSHVGCCPNRPLIGMFP